MEDKLRDEGVTAAISAAIFSYFDLEKGASRKIIPQAHVTSFWSSFGRQEQMNMRIFCQLRMIRH
jgi:hypothetical protein